MDENARRAILQKLRETEDVYQVKIPLAIKSGSRVWGFAQGRFSRGQFFSLFLRKPLDNFCNNRYTFNRCHFSLFCGMAKI